MNRDIQNLQFCICFKQKFKCHIKIKFIGEDLLLNVDENKGGKQRVVFNDP